MELLRGALPGVHAERLLARRLDREQRPALVRAGNAVAIHGGTHALEGRSLGVEVVDELVVAVGLL